ncbi:hypothetical protein [Microbacterium sp. CIAB417]|uniref:hypothetical protein n=1 Tax=Microbacterium sp. CIAB417 TaxID=2860287 RepID=UPI001FAC00C9|nr:hypothetical protein [Microbacterium sp. CIAB417]
MSIKEHDDLRDDADYFEDDVRREFEERFGTAAPEPVSPISKPIPIPSFRPLRRR